jgi:hypothetical protein
MEISHGQTVVVDYMNKPSKPDERLSPPLNCQSCSNTFKSKAMLNMLICVPHLKIMPAKTPACDLYSTQNKKN